MNNNKLTNTNFNFSKNLITSVIVPAVVCVVAIIMAIFMGLNKGTDFKGGILVSVVAENYNLEITEDYNNFTSEVNQILTKNGVNAESYMVETDSVTYDSVLVIKIAHNKTAKERNAIIKAIKSDLVTKFYANTPESEIELRNLVNVSTFGSSFVLWKLIAGVVAGMVAVLALCVYVGLRTMSMHTAVMTGVSSAISIVLTAALATIFRIQINTPSLAIMTSTVIISSIVAFMLLSKANEVLKSGNYERKSNSILANNAVKASLNKFVFIAAAAFVAFITIALANTSSQVLHLGLLAAASIVAISYTNIFIIPAIFALTYVRKVKKEKIKKDQKQDKLEEAEVLKETDLNNLVSN